VEVVASLSQGRTAATQCGLFIYKSVPVIFEPLCIKIIKSNVPYADICGGHMVLSFKLDRTVRRLVTPNMHHE